MEDSCLTILYWFLPSINMNGIHIAASLLNLICTSLSIQPLEVVTEHLIWVPYLIQQISTGYLFYMVLYMFHDALQIRPTFCFPHCVHKSVPYVCISIEKVKVFVTQSCLTLCNPMDCSPPDSSVHGISQGRILEWVVISFPRVSFQPRDW